MLDNLRVSGWVKSSFVDFPGTVSTVLFLSGCNLRCPYCHNPELVRKNTEELEWEPIREYLEKRRGIIDGAVISGGEPTLHNSLGELCAELRELGLRVKIDTNGLNPEIIRQNMPDYLALDIKTSPERYRLLKTPFPDTEKRLRHSLEIVKEMGDDAEVRITAVPGIVDENVITELCRTLKEVKHIYLQQFSRETQLLDSSFAQKKAYDPEELKKWQSVFGKAGLNCQIRGI
ncbi:MAG: anaerobic ribonucleoside-triphosphate reductase activating protein [Chitinispirillaceae bacterium]